ncbi:origin recognition complex subunit [Stipitochalara longipes BDJ]|nr:origin recognition complex subunit [Stipitochalara longipes BDJ]
MSDDEENHSHVGFHELDHQQVYVYTPANAPDDATRPAKRRKVANVQALIPADVPARISRFEPLLSGLESSECVALRQQTFEYAWSKTEAQVQAILDEANEDTLEEVTAFVDSTVKARHFSARVPTGFIVTGPNISSQSPLFKQLSSRLKAEISGPTVVLRSSDASNLKAVLKQLIRDSTNRSLSRDDEEGISNELDGRKLLNYDLEILHSFVEAHGSQAVVIAFQDSEAFDSSLISELVTLFSSWADRIPFVLLFGIATSLDLFRERLQSSASRLLDGMQFDIEQTSSLVEKIFQKAVAGSGVPLRLGSGLISSLMERQYDHVQSVQSFIAALKYAYVCHFYGNPLSFLCDASTGDIPNLIRSHHIEVIRALPSFRSMVGRLVDNKQLKRAKTLLKDEKALVLEIAKAQKARATLITQLLRAMALIASSSPDPVDKIELYMTTFRGELAGSEFIKRVLDSAKRMTPDDLLNFVQNLSNVISNGCTEMELAGWVDEDDELLGEIREIYSKVLALAMHSVETGNPIRSSYAIHSKGLRTTVIAQRVQLSYESSTLTDQDKEFTALVDRLTGRLKKYFSQLANPQELFLNEAWLYDWTLPHKSAFTPRPREAIELALSTPYRYLSCDCCESIEGLSSTHPATAILYQMYLETGSLINVFDLWSAFFEMLGGGEEQKYDERDALVMFYRGLADLKSLGMVKQSKKKADHLAKLVWKGL